MTKQDFIDAQENQFFNTIDKSLEKELQKELENFKNGTNNYKNRIRLFLSDAKANTITNEIREYICDKLISKYKFVKEDIIGITISSDYISCIVVNLKF